MNKISFPLTLQMQGTKVSDLHEALQLLLDRGIILPNDEPKRRQLSAALQGERAEQMYGTATRKIVTDFQDELRLDGRGEINEATANALNRLLDQLNGPPSDPAEFIVKGSVWFSDKSPAAGVKVSAFDRDLRNEQALGQTQTNRQGSYQLPYSVRQFLKAERGSADLVVKALAADGSLLAASPILFNAPSVSEINLTIPADVMQPPSLFERIGRELPPLMGDLKVQQLEEDKEHQDLTFLSGETGFEKPTLARFVLAHKLPELQAEFWFVILGGSFYEFSEDQSLKEQLEEILKALSSLDATTVRKALTRGFKRREISEAFRKNVPEWVEAFLKVTAQRTVSKSGQPSFTKLALDHAGIADPDKQEIFARLFNEHKALTAKLLCGSASRTFAPQREI
jgi:hypothetical protein